MRLEQKFVSIKHTVALIYLLIFATLGICSFTYAFPVESHQEAEVQKLLKDILDEVLEIECPENESFVKGEFWMDLDGNMGNKEEHIVIMRHDDGHELKMTVQVTYYMPDKGQHFIRFAHITKTVLCGIKDSGPKVYRSDYSNDEMAILFPELLRGIRNKKEILKLIKKKE
jgi:hypothetical protein